MIPKFNIGDRVTNNGIKGSVSAIELDSMITANVQPYYVVKMEYGKQSSLEYSGFFNVIKRKIGNIKMIIIIQVILVRIEKLETILKKKTEYLELGKSLWCLHHWTKHKNPKTTTIIL